MSYQQQIDELEFTDHELDTRSRENNHYAYGHIAELHLDDVANLWTVWYGGLNDPNFDRDALAELERRIQSHIAGMRLQEPAAWDRCLGQLETIDAAELFAAAQLAFRSYDVNKIRLVVNTAEHNPHAIPGLVSALAWLPEDIFSPWRSKLSSSKSLYHKYYAVEAARLRGEDLGDLLDNFCQRQECLNHPYLGPALLRSLGEFKHHQTRSALLQMSLAEHCEFWRLYSLVLLGEVHLVERLTPYLDSADLQIDALQLIFRILPMDQAHVTISDLAADQNNVSCAILAVGILGDPHAVPWLIGLMHNNDVARLAGFAYSLITGTDLEAAECIFDESPEAIDETVHRELQSENRLVELQSLLPWPDADAVWAHWQQISSGYEPGLRYFAGKNITEQHCINVLDVGFQLHRKCAAFELALINPDLELYNTSGIQYPEK